MPDYDSITYLLAKRYSSSNMNLEDMKSMLKHIYNNYDGEVEQGAGYVWGTTENGAAWVRVQGGTTGGSGDYDDTALRALINAKYTKPSTGIPESDLSSTVRTKLNSTGGTSYDDTELRSIVDGKMSRYVIRLSKVGTSFYVQDYVTNATLTFDQIKTAITNTSNYVVCVYGNSKLRPQYVSTNEMMFIGLDRASAEAKVLRLLITPTATTYETFSLASSDDLSDFYNKTTIDSMVNEKYTLPSSGIPESDLSYSVREKLNGNGGASSQEGVNAVDYGLSTTSSTNNDTALKNAIADAMSNNTFVYIPSGDYVFTNPITITDTGSVEIIGEKDCYASSMNREDVGDEKHTIHTGSCLVYRGSGAMFRHTNCTIKLSNLGFYNERSDKTYFRTARLVGQEDLNHSLKGKIYIDNCVVAGFKVAFGNTSTNEFCCVLANNTRFSFCDAAIARNVDGRITDCTFNKCVNAIIFDGDTGFTTIADSRIEWCTGAGILIQSAGVHDVTIIGCEFDRCGNEGIKATAGKRIIVSNCQFRRNGVLDDVGYHVNFSNVEGCVITGCMTRYMEILDTTGEYPKKPELSYTITDCTRVTNVGNDWSGCANPQTDDFDVLNENINNSYDKSTVDSMVGGKYTLPSTGIPESDLAESIRTKLNNIGTGSGGTTYDDTELRGLISAKYTKPSTGIPKSDLASAVQTSLGKADTALQSVPSGYATETWVTNKSYYAKPSDGIPESDLSSAVRSKLNATGGGGGVVSDVDISVEEVSEIILATIEDVEALIDEKLGGVLDAYY